MIQGALIIDLELTRRGDLCALAGLRCDDDAVFKAEDLDARRRPDALRALAALGQGARLLVGHNLAAHDRPWLAERHPDHPLLRLPWADTLVLSPLAFPERPYHRLIKDHRLVRDSISAPLADCRACKVVLDDTIAALGARATARPALLAFLRAALTDPEVPQANAGYAAVFDAAGVPGGLGWAEAARALRATLDGLVCVEGERTIELTPSDALAFAYAASWLTVPPGSGLPAWVRVQFPATRALIDRLRGTPCRRQDCRFCRDHHEPEGWLQRVFGYPAFRPTPAAPDGGSLQRAIVEAGLRGEPLYAVLPTGTGKSACFQIPAIALHRAVGALTVVVSPLQSLMKDQVDQLRDREPFAGTINGSLTPPERERALEDVQAGATSLLYVSPEQIRNNGVRRALASRRIGAWVIDEAHCLSDWGHDFRTDYLYLPRYIRELAQRQGVPPPPVHCFTGTSQRAVTDSILALFQAELGQRLRVFDGGAERDNLVFHVIELPERDRPQRVLELLEEHLPERSAGAAIVFCATQKGTERAAEWLKAHGHAAEAYHAGLDGQTRRDVQDRFLRGELQVIAATSAFGMGVDKPDVRLVVHLDIPGSLEAYLQQAGRAGRDREEAHCVLLFSPGDIDTQFRLASRSQLTLRELQALWRGLQRVPSARERDAAGEIELRVVTRGELARLDAVAGLFDPNDPMTDTRINAAVSWLERGGLFERDENHTRVFQGKPKLPTLAAAEQRVAELDLPAPKAAQWRAILRRLYDAADDEGLSADDLAALALGVDAGDPLGAGARVLDVLHQMAEAGLVTSGVQMTAFLAWGVADPSTERLERLLTAQGHLLHELRARAPDPDGWLEASPRLIADQLAASGVEVRPERVVQLLRALERDGLGYDAQARSADLRWQGRDRMQVMLRRGWSEIVELARSNATAARALLADLERRTGGTKGKNVLVSFSVDELVRVLQGTLTLAGRLRSAPQAVDQALLLMHDARVLTLQGGLAVFRQAMALRRRQDAPRTLLAEKIEPLRHHEAERTVQIHVVDAYARLGASAIDEAQALARDWFGAPRDVFLQRWFPKRREVLRVGTSAESYRRIVDGVDEAQRPIVSAAPGANLLVLAGPGSGKTRVLVHRVAWLIRVRRVRPESVVVVCYTRANAIELRRRLRALIDVDARGVLVTTLHGLALRLTGRSPGHDELDFEGLLADAAAILRRERVPDGAEADEIRDLVLRGCAHLLVDEYQDLDAHQASLLDAIAGRSEADEDQRLSFLAVGDDDQSIFQFRGGTSTWIRDFARTWGATTHTLTRCYRCAPAILAAAEAMIRPVPGRLKAGTPLRVDDAR
ncbi:MAG TPA: RecQ family ATP-dependent DNA helicase, partial [Myxococcota bacterium]|nr:RecQ family ATP-dependent DNA helicase [Myxococcota bacterium]